MDLCQLLISTEKGNSQCLEMNYPVNDAVCTRLREYQHKGMSMKEANESEEQCTT